MEDRESIVNDINDMWRGCMEYEYMLGYLEGEYQISQYIPEYLESREAGFLIGYLYARLGGLDNEV